MIRNYLVIAWRNLLKNKVFSLINILGLTIGITCCMMIFLFITNEFSVDRFHKKGASIYRLMRDFQIEGRPERVPYVSAPYATALLNDFPGQVEEAIRVLPTNALVKFGEHSFNEKKFYYADAGFFNLFSYPLVKGDANTVLKDPSSIVLTESTAKKYFGSEDPIGKVVEVDKRWQLKVTGIAKDLPPNTHLDFDIVMPIVNFQHEEWFSRWINNNGFTYLLLKKDVPVAALEKQFPAFMEKYMGPAMKQMGFHGSLSLTPLKDIYFEPAGAFDNVRHGDKTVVYIFLSIAVLILVIACINFMNLSTIRAVERSKEVGLRKVMGALRNHLIWQFIGESLLLTLIACVLSLGLLQLLMPVYNRLLGNELVVSWNTVPLYIFIAGVILVVGFLAGSYPAFFLSAFSPIQALKGKLRLGKGGALFRQALVVLQFSISVLLIIGTIIIMNQMRFVRNKSLGYDKAQSVVIPIDNTEIEANRIRFKHTLEANSNVEMVSLMSGEPGGFFDIHSYEVEGTNDQAWKFRSEFADFEYVKTLGLKIVAGRDFSPAFPTDTTESVLINRTAATKLGYTAEQAVGKWIRNRIRDDHNRRIIGVVEDFNFLSLKENMDALVISPSEDRRVVVVKLRAGKTEPGLAAIRSAYASAAPVYPLEYSFLDQQFDILYRKDVRQQTIMSIFAGLAIFIACLGLFGLASFTAAKRIKEIGVRKVLGSTSGNIVLLLSKDLLKPVILATVVAIPLGYYIMGKWLENFAYRTPMQWWIFALAAFIVIAVALATVSIKAIRAALTNPITSLRSE